MSDQFLKTIKQTIMKIEPDAEIIFFGSHRRGDTTEESDWDFLILLNGAVNEKRKDAIRYELFNLELEHGKVISSVIIGHDDWNSPRYQVTPLHKNIQREGIAL